MTTAILTSSVVTAVYHSGWFGLPQAPQAIDPNQVKYADSNRTDKSPVKPDKPAKRKYHFNE